MPRFRYNAIDVDGRPLSGEMDAVEASEVASRLTAMGAQVESINPVREAGDRETGVGGRSIQRLRSVDFERLSSQLGDLTESGLPLVSGLTALADELPRSRFRRGLQSIIRQLQAGGELAAVLKGHGAPPDLQALVAAGANTGHLGELLGRYAADRRRTADIKRRTLLALAYPLIVLALMVALMLFILLWVVPQFKTILDDFGTELPWITEIVIRLSNLVINHGLWLFAGIAAVLVMLATIYATVFDRVTRRRWNCRIPVLGQMLRFSALARFAHLLAVLVENGVPLPAALTLSADSTGDAELQAAGWLMAADIDAGEPLDKAAYNAAAMSSTLVEALAWHQQTDVFADALRALSEMYESRAHAQSGLVAAFWMPIVLCVTGLTISFTMIALFAPLFKLLNDLS